MTRQEETPEKKKRLGCAPYVFGGASFVPLLGVPMGIIAIVWGLVKLKSGGWKVCIIGLLGISVTIGLYGSLFYKGFIERGGIYDELRGTMTKSSLAVLVKEIEFYKINNGLYPESLNDLQTTNNHGFFIIHDTSSVTLNLKEPKLFHYEVVDDGYFLFSEGIDGRPFTADDVFPEVELSDKIGYKTPVNNSIEGAKSGVEK